MDVLARRNRLADSFGPIASGGGNVATPGIGSSERDRSTMARTSPRSNQRASASSSASIVISSLNASARQPIISVDGNGHDQHDDAERSEDGAHADSFERRHCSPEIDHVIAAPICGTAPAVSRSETT